MSQHILLIEDDDDLAVITDAVVSDAGYVVERVTTVDDAIASCDARTPDVALVDVQLPDRPGWDFVEQASRWPDMRVVVYTVHSSEPETIAKANELGVHALVAKSSDPLKLVDVIRRVAHD
jgi:DNA-binding response OmpR family regulator